MEEKMEGLKVAVGVTDEVAFPEWLGETADMDWDELTDEQRTWFENYRAMLDEAHEGLAVRPKVSIEDERSERVKKMANLMKEEIGQAELNARAKQVHFMSFDSHGSKGPGVYCSCGMSKQHKRGKVLATWADKHFEKYGHYWKRS